MNKALLFAAIAALSITGCKKKDNEASPAGTASGATATAPAAAAKASEPAAAAAKPKTCEELGGKKEGDACAVKSPAPVESSFTGKFDSDMMNPEPGAIFKVTNKLSVPVKIHTAQLYAYDKDGKQLDLDINGTKNKYAQDSMMSLIELGPNETKDFRHSIGKKNLPAEMATLQVEFVSWQEDKTEFSRAIDNMDVRPKDGWK